MDPLHELLKRGTKQVSEVQQKSIKDGSRESLQIRKKQNTALEKKASSQIGRRKLAWRRKSSG